MKNSCLTTDYPTALIVKKLASPGGISCMSALLQRQSICSHRDNMKGNKSDKLKNLQLGSNNLGRKTKYSRQAKTRVTFLHCCSARNENIELTYA